MRDFDIQGHRGARGLMPENTLAGFKKAVEIGVSTIELDVGITKDEVVVVIHDFELAAETTRDIDGNWLCASGPLINELTLYELKRFDVGRANPAKSYASEHPRQEPVDGEKVPALGEVFDLGVNLGVSSVNFNIEIKSDPNHPEKTVSPRKFAECIFQDIKRHQMENRVTVQSFDWRVLQEFNNIAPNIVRSYLTVEQSWMNTIQRDQDGSSAWLAGYDNKNFGDEVVNWIKAAGGKVWTPYYEDITIDNVSMAHDLGLLVKVWTVNNRHEMLNLINMQVDGIITDYPDILKGILQQ